MPTYWYRALGQGGATSEGTIVAPTRKDALQRLISSGENPLDLREQAARDRAQALSFKFRRRAIRLATFTRQLATLSASGVPIVRSLTVLIDQVPDKRGRGLLTSIRESIQGGSTFADALGEHPDVFPRLMTSMVRVGEVGGTLDEQLLELSELYEREEELKGEVQAAVAYPALVLVAGIISAVILIGFFIPRLKTMFVDLGQDLPLPTRILLGVSDGVRNHSWGLFFAVLLLFAGWQAARRSPKFRLALDRFKLLLPVVGRFIRNLTVARLTRLLGTLTHGGINIVDALGIVEPVVGNEAIRLTVHDMTSRIRTGESLAALMKESDIFPPLSVQMVAVGEETGHLDQMLLRVADAYDRETSASTKVMTSMLAPALILVVAAIVGFIIVAMMLPIFQLSTVMR